MLRPLWSVSLSAPVRGLSLAREAGRLLAWDEGRWLFWLDRDGRRQAQAHQPAAIVAGAASEDGSAFAVADGAGRIAWLAPDLLPHWEQRFPDRPTAVALDPLGLYLAAADAGGRLLLFDRGGRIVREAVCPRPAQHLAFVPNAAALVAAADFGWLAWLDLKSGEWAWRDAPVVHFGSLAVGGTGEPIVVACFSDGLRAYRRNGLPWELPARVPPCRLASLAYDARRIVTAGLDQTLYGFGPKGEPLFAERPDGPVLALALAGLGETLYAALGDETLRAFDSAGAG